MSDDSDITPAELRLEIGTLRSELFQLRGLKESLLMENRRLKELLNRQIDQ